MKIHLTDTQKNDIYTITDACKLASIIYKHNIISLKEAIHLSEELVSLIYGFIIDNRITKKQAVKLYMKLFTIEDYMNSSCIQNNKLSDNFLFIKENLGYYESGSKLVII